MSPTRIRVCNMLCIVRRLYTFFVLRNPNNNGQNKYSVKNPVSRSKRVLDISTVVPPVAEHSERLIKKQKQKQNKITYPKIPQRIRLVFSW